MNNCDRFVGYHTNIIMRKDISLTFLNNANFCHMYELKLKKRNSYTDKVNSQTFVSNA